jgi:hypothetical protein
VNEYSVTLWDMDGVTDMAGVHAANIRDALYAAGGLMHTRPNLSPRAAVLVAPMGPGYLVVTADPAPPTLAYGEAASKPLELVVS